MKLLISIFSLILSATLFAKEGTEKIKVYIKPNSQLTSIKFNITELNSRGFYAIVTEVNSNLRDKFYVFDKAGEKKYIVRSIDIVEIENDINLLPEEKTEIHYPPPSQLKMVNSYLPLESEMSFHLDSLNFSALNEFLQTTVNTTTAPRYYISTRIKTELPIDVGVNLNYQSTSWIDQNQISSTLSTLTAGPDFKLKLLTSPTYNLNAILSYEFSPLYEISSPAGKDKFSAYLWGLGFQNEFKTEYGIFNIGVDFRKHFLTFKSSNRNITELYSSEYSVTSLGASLGFKMEWNL